ncbi:hypothetical protein [Shimia sp. MIT910701]|uniref:hypothetical protein n=1 Tax=Shimia sp. MIT910701 TaxID=3096987 RepID=UPI0039995BCD
MPGFVDLTSTLGLQIRHDNLRLVGEMPDFRPGLDGWEQVTFTENRTWRGSVVFPPMFGKDLALLRSVPTRLRGRAGVLRLPLLNLASPRFEGDPHRFWRQVGVSEEDIERGYSRFDDQKTFDDGTGFALPDTDDERLSNNLAEGSVAVKLTSFVGRNLAIGDRFSIDASLYEVESNDDGQVQFSPSLRKSALEGALVRVSEPHIDVRLASSGDWDVFANLGVYSEPLTVNVVEAFNQ